MGLLRYMAMAVLFGTAIQSQSLLAQGGGAAPASLSDVTSSTASEEKPPIIPTSAFASRSFFQAAKLSPDGAQMAAMANLKDGKFLVVLDAASRQLKAKYPVSKETELEWYRWAGNSKLVLSLSSQGKFQGEDALFTRLALIDQDTNWIGILGPKTGVIDGDNVIHVAKDGSYLLVSTQKTIYDYPSVFRYELEQDGKVTVVQSPKDGVWDWSADNAGVVRLGTGWYRNRMRVFYRPDASSKLELVGKLREGDEEGRFWNVAQIVSGSDKGYVLRENDAGRVGLHLFDYSTREVVETIYENPDWDLDSATIRDGKPIAAFYTDDRERVVWFDEAREEQYAALSRALKGYDLWVTSRARDNSRMIVWAGGEADPGVLYMFEPAAGRLDQLLELRPTVNFQHLARPKPISYSARDGTLIHGYLTLPRGREAANLPLIILPHGGPYGVRDSLRYNDEVQLLANRGYAVLQPNFRGSDGYGEEFTKLGTGAIGRGMQDDLDDAMDWAVAEGIADPSRVCLVGGSYGGYAALWGIIRNPERYRCAASWAGVTDWDMMLKYDRQFFSRKGGKKWRARVEGDEEFDLDSVSPYRLAETLQRPVLLAHGTEDSNVPFRQFRKFKKATKKAAIQPTELVIEDEGHSFSKPENEQKWYDALVTFLAEHNPPD
ncbi:alpha/beta hydrolase family protein [Qipengyuania sp. DGS5-3]|uniref:alpha/beta hydrolase family protein n=1 Tax=Qipengyuania sp. DGS5-3 TaxID=3349632 RepID=UPI0036D3B59D